MSELNRDSGARTLTSEQLDKLFHSPALRRLFQENASDEYALIWLLSKHTKDSGSEKIYLKDIVKELNLPLPKVTDTALTSVQTHRQTLRKYHQRVVSAFGEERFLHLLSEIAQLEEILRQEAEKVGDEP